MALTEEQKRERNRERALLKKYGITIAEYEELLNSRNGNCWICNRPPKNNRLAVDHDHKFRYFKITTVKENGHWAAYNSDLSYILRGVGKTKSEAIQAVRQHLKKASVRGLLCFQCNSGLRKYSDDPERLTNAAKYLTNFRLQYAPKEPRTAVYVRVVGGTASVPGK